MTMASGLITNPRLTGWRMYYLRQSLSWTTCCGVAAEENYDGVCLRARDHRIRGEKSSFGK